MNVKKGVVSMLAAGAVVLGGLMVAAPAQATIYIYEHDNYSAGSRNLGNGYRKTLPGFNDVTSSLKVTGGDVATLYQHENYKGCQIAFKIGSPSLKTWPFCTGYKWDWNDETSSVY